MDQIRVRFAPSPTGALHIGSARTALFNFVFAKKFGGKFILRIEDTDKERSKKEFELDITENLKWLGINWDEFYLQSERVELYSGYLKKLIDQNSAYYCFCAKDDLEKQREEMMSMGRAWQYPGTCRKLTQKEANENIKANKPFVIRLKVQNDTVKFKDVIRGDIEFGPDSLSDFIIAKNIREPLYNFAAAVDDYEMKITHVIRGEDHIPNTPKQLLIFKALNLKPPQYAHLPLILGIDKSKLSKRKGGVTVLDFKKSGFMPEALINFLILLGWHPHEDKELLTLPEIINSFSLERVQKGGAVFNENKLLFFNGFYLKNKTNEEILLNIEENLSDVFEINGDSVKLRGRHTTLNKKQFLRVIGLEKERLKTLRDLEKSSEFLFSEKLEYPPDLLIWKNSEKKESLSFLEKSFKIISEIGNAGFNAENLKNILIAASPEEDKGKMLWPLRVALSGKESSPPPFDILEILERTESQKRLSAAISKLKI